MLIMEALAVQSLIPYLVKCTGEDYRFLLTMNPIAFKRNSLLRKIRVGSQGYASEPNKRFEDLSVTALSDPAQRYNIILWATSDRTNRSSPAKKKDFY